MCGGMGQVPQYNQDKESRPDLAEYIMWKSATKLEA